MFPKVNDKHGRLQNEEGRLNEHWNDTERSSGLRSDVESCSRFGGVKMTAKPLCCEEQMKIENIKKVSSLKYKDPFYEIK